MRALESIAQKVVAILDLSAFVIFGTLFSMSIALLLAATPRRRKRKSGNSPLNRLSFPVYDLITNKYESMLEDALLGDYISRDYYIYLDFANGRDRFENISGRIFFHSIAAHSNNGLYDAGFRKMNMLLVEIKALWRAFEITRRDAIDFIKAHDPHILGLNGLIVSRLFNLPFVIHLNSDFEMKYRGTGKTSSWLFASRGLEKLFESALLTSSDLIMADREYYRNSRSFPKKCAGRYRAIGVRVDNTHYSEPASRRNLKDELRCSGSKVLIYVGRLHPVKYPEDAIKAFRIIKKAIHNAALIVVGTGVLKGSLEHLVRVEGLEGSVFFLGAKGYEELKNLLYSSDLLLAPHGGVTLVEAALAQTPTVAYDFDWHSEFLEDEKMGYLVPFRDIEGMARRAVEVLQDEELRRKMGVYCRAVAMSQCSREKSVANERRIYEDLLAG